MKNSSDGLTIKDLTTRAKQDPDPIAFDNSSLEKHLDPEKNEMPPLDHSDDGNRQASRMRIVRALHSKFGTNWRIDPKLRSALSDYDKEVRFHKFYQQRRGMIYGR